MKGVNTISGLTGGAYTLTQENAAYATIILAGTLASDLTITVPSTANKWTFINNLTMAGFYVIIKVSGQTGCNIPGGVNLDITCDGTNMFRADRHLVGEYFFHAGSAVPNGALECNGATPLRLSAIDLFAKISTTHGTGNGTTTFTLPDGYTAGKFLRSRTASVALGTAQTNQNKAHTHTGSGTTSGQSQTHTHSGSGTTSGQSQQHTHAYYQGKTVGWTNGTAGNANVYTASDFNQSDYNSVDHSHTYAFTSSGASVDHTHTYSFTTSSDGGTEARPENISAILCIRY